MTVIARWQALTPREQRGLVALGAFIGILLFWLIAIAPALQILRDSDQRRVRIEQQHNHMLALQQQAQALQTRTPLARDEALRQLQSLTPSPQIQLQVQGDRVSVQLKNVPATTLASWLSQARHQAQALPTEMHLRRSSNPSAIAWDGSLVLSLPNRGAGAP